MSYKMHMENIRSVEARLQKMQEAGLLTEKQKQDMEEAVTEVQKNLAPVKTTRKALSTGLLIAVLAIILILFIVSLFGVNASEPDTIQKVSETFNQIGKVGIMDKSSQSFLFLTSLFGIPLIIAIVSFMFLYNTLVTNEENVLGSWAQVESNLQRRSDLIPDLVSTVKGYMKHEKEVLTEVTASRSGGLGEIVNTLEKMYSSDSSLRKIAYAAKDRLSDDAFMKSLASEQQKIGEQVNKLKWLSTNHRFKKNRLMSDAKP